MREIDRLIELMQWTDDINYAEFIEKKALYEKHPTQDNFIEAQNLALGMYSEAKSAFSCGDLTMDELQTIRQHLFSNLWKCPV